jgi:hypothetical protein
MLDIAVIDTTTDAAGKDESTFRQVSIIPAGESRGTRIHFLKRNNCPEGITIAEIAHGMAVRMLPQDSDTRDFYEKGFPGAKDANDRDYLIYIIPKGNGSAHDVTIVSGAPRKIVATLAHGFFTHIEIPPDAYPAGENIRRVMVLRQAHKGGKGSL